MIQRRGLLFGGMAASWCAACAERPAATGLSTTILPDVETTNVSERSVALRADAARLCCSAELAAENAASDPVLSPLVDGANIAGVKEAGPRLRPGFSVAEDCVGRMRVRALYWPRDPKHAHPDDQSFLRAQASRGSGGTRAACRSGAARTAAGSHPAHVLQALSAAVSALRVFSSFNFLPPMSDDGSVELHLVSMDARGATAPNIDHILIERTLRGEDMQATVAHEIFHRIQYSYNAQPALSSMAEDTVQDKGQNADQIYPEYMWREGTARVAELMCGASPRRYLADAAAWFGPNRQALFGYRRPGDGRFRVNSYGAALFWKYLAEQSGEEARVPASVLGAQEAAVQHAILNSVRVPGGTTAAPVSVDDIRAACLSLPGHASFDRFAYVDLPDGSRAVATDETRWGNFLIATVLRGSAGSDRRFGFRGLPEDGVPRGTRRGEVDRATPHFDDLAPPESEPVAGGPARELILANGPALNASGRWTPGREAEQQLLARMYPRQSWDLCRPIAARMLPPYAMQHFSLRMTPGPTRLVRVRVDRLVGLDDGLVQVVQLGRNGELLDIIRGESATPSQRPAPIDYSQCPDPSAAGPLFDRVVACRQAAEMLVLVASRERGGDFRLALSRPAEAPILQATTWNGIQGRHYPASPAERAWDWKSSDVRANLNTRKLIVNFRNGGTRPVGFMNVVAWAMPAVSFPRSTAWEPLRAIDPPSSTTEIWTDDECERWLNFDEGAVRTKQNNFAAMCERLPGLGTTLGRDFQFVIPESIGNDIVMAVRANARHDPNGAMTLLGTAGLRLPAALRDGRGLFEALRS